MHPYTNKRPPPEVTVLWLSLSISFSCADLTSRSVPLQLFIAQRDFEDGQTSAEARPDRAESNADDNEVSEADDEDTPAQTASLGMGFKR